jgi:cell division protein FtsN
MTHDFARQRAARAGRDKKPSSPTWLWFVSGLVIGVLLSFLVYLATLAPGPVRPVVAAAQEKAPSTEAPAAKASPAKKPEFTFYTDLPQITTDKPAQPEAVAGKSAPAAAPAPAATPKPAAPAPATTTTATATTAKPNPPKPEKTASSPPPVEVPEPADLSLQAGAFRDVADANQRRADITLLGYPVRVVSAAGGAGETRYRVQVGPFATAAELSDARGALKDQGIDVR